MKYFEVKNEKGLIVGYVGKFKAPLFTGISHNRTSSKFFSIYSWGIA